MDGSRWLVRAALRVLLSVTGLVGATALSGCLVAGYSSTGGGFIWPGGLGVIVLLALLFFFLRGRR